MPGNPDESLLIRAIRYRDDELRMPPKAKLPDAVIADFEAWVKIGAPDPRTGPSGVAARPSIDLAKGREFWSFRPPKKSAPAGREAGGLAARRRRPVPPRGARIPRARPGRRRRPAEAASPGDVRSHRPAAHARGTRRLPRGSTPPTPSATSSIGCSPRPASASAGAGTGSTWRGSPSRAARRTSPIPQAWRYRDWAIASFNADKPYDQFVREQIAGDLLPADDDRERADQIIATGFLALGSKAHDAENRGQFVLDVVDEQIEATTRAFLGLTVACARCHDHKMDPIPQRDYYALSGIFRSTQTCSGTLAGVFPNFNASPLIELPTGAGVPPAVPPLTAGQRAAMEDRLAALVRERDSIPPGEANRDRLRRANSMLATVRYRLLIDRPGGPPRTFAMGVRERDEAVDSPLYVRGELDQPGEVVPRGLVRVVCAETPAPIAAGSGRRELADWLASPANPLTARVIVNRVWLHLFGRGLVPTPDNFGAAGQRPSHPELLDTLAVDFMADGWSIKRLIRRIVLSRAYGLDSSHDPHNFEADPDNALVWRMSKRRLEAEALRDALLFVSGRLAAEPPVGSAVARTGEGLALFSAGCRPGCLGHASIGLPAGGPGQRARIARALRLRRPEPRDGRAGHDDRPGPGALLHERHVRVAASRGPGRTGPRSRGGRCEAGRSGLSARPRAAADGRRAGPRPRVPPRFCRTLGGTDPARAAWPAFCQALFASAEFRYLY